MTQYQSIIDVMCDKDRAKRKLDGEKRNIFKISIECKNLERFSKIIGTHHPTASSGGLRL